MEALSFATAGGVRSPSRLDNCAWWRPHLSPPTSALRRYKKPTVPLFWLHYTAQLSPAPRPRLISPRAVGCGHDGLHHRHHDHHHQAPGDHHHHGHDHGQLNGAQAAVLRFARAVGWADLADLLREHLQLCCCSMALLLLAAACPYALPNRAAKPLQNALIAIAFPLVGV